MIPVKNESNVVVLFICTFRDITSFKVKYKYKPLDNLKSTFFRILFLKCICSLGFQNLQE